MTRRRLFLPLLIALVSFACSRPDRTSEKSTADAGQPVQGDSAIVRFESDPDSLNPISSALAVSQYALTGANNSQVYELLLGYNTKDWDLTEPLLAEAIPTLSDDHLTYTVKIRD